MINKSIFCIDLSFSDLKVLVNARPFKGCFWKYPPNDDIKAIKNKI